MNWRKLNGTESTVKRVALALLDSLLFIVKKYLYAGQVMHHVNF